MPRKKSIDPLAEEKKKAIKAESAKKSHAKRKRTNETIKYRAVREQVNNEKKKGKDPKARNYIRKEGDEYTLGEKYGVCRKCGKTFEQEIREGMDSYTDYKYCPECRTRMALEKEKRAEEEARAKGQADPYNATLRYTPFPAQQMLHDEFEKCRFLLLACGNRFGKDRFTTMAGIKYFAEILNENRHIEKLDLTPSAFWWIVAPTERMAKQNWKELKKYFPRQWVVAVSEASMTMETIGGGIIEVRSAYDPESLTGTGLDLVTVTEAARIQQLDRVWANLEARLNSAGRGRTIDKSDPDIGFGKAIINSSPLGKNYFYDLFTMGQKNHPNYSSYWFSAQLPWTANPVNAKLAKQIVHTRYGDITYEEDLRRRLGDRLYRQNYLGEFEAENQEVFKDFERNCVTNIYSDILNLKDEKKRDEFIDEWRRPSPFGVYRIGYDIATGSSKDSPALVIRDKISEKIVRIVDMYGLNYDRQYDTVAFWSKHYNNAECVYSLTGHTAVKGQLEKRGVYEIPVNEQAGRKAEYVQRLVHAVQTKTPRILMDGSVEAQTLIYQMNDYVEKGNGVGNNPKYSNKTDDGHDDFVSAMYLAYFDFDEQDNEPIFMGMYATV